jgi:hypothetical protein
VGDQRSGTGGVAACPRGGVGTHRRTTPGVPGGQGREEREDAVGKRRPRVHGRRGPEQPRPITPFRRSTAATRRPVAGRSKTAPEATGFSTVGPTWANRHTGQGCCRSRLRSRSLGPREKTPPSQTAKGPGVPRTSRSRQDRHHASGVRACPATSASARPAWRLDARNRGVEGVPGALRLPRREEAGASRVRRGAAVCGPATGAPAAAHPHPASTAASEARPGEA